MSQNYKIITNYKSRMIKNFSKGCSVRTIGSFAKHSSCRKIHYLLQKKLEKYYNSLRLYSVFRNNFVLLPEICKE